MDAKCVQNQFNVIIMIKGLLSILEYTKLKNKQSMGWSLYTFF
jgi:hypothetical protein